VSNFGGHSEKLLKRSTKCSDNCTIALQFDELEGKCVNQIQLQIDDKLIGRYIAECIIEITE